MEKEHISVKNMWERFLSSMGEDMESTDKSYSSWFFCDNEKDANQLAQLVIKGEKKATASLYNAFEFENEPLPKVGEYSIITDWDGMAQCIIQTVKVDVVPFKDVTEEFAAKEGEGDKTLDYWRKVHWKFFSKEMKEIGKEPSDDMLVVCEEFKMVFK